MFFNNNYFVSSKKKRNFADVIELQRHIEILLLENDCVIVPDFGGFMTHHIPAHYDSEERLFLPPTRTLGFNSQVHMNDSLLVHSYMTAYDISYPEAMRRIELEVNELRQTLQSEGSYVLNDLGTLTVNAEGNYEFVPVDAGILSPDLYGLGALSVRKRHDKVSMAEQTAVNEKNTEEQTAETGLNLIEFTDNDDTDKAILIKMSWIRNAVAVAAAAIVFFLLATPVMNSNLDSTTMSGLSHQVLYKLIPQDTNLTPATPVEKAEATTIDQQADTLKVQASQQIVKPETAKATATYTIVLASQVKRNNAEEFVEQLHKSGYKDATIYVYNNVIRVVLGVYNTQEEAYKKLSSLRRIEGFENAWVYKKAES